MSTHVVVEGRLAGSEIFQFGMWFSTLGSNYPDFRDTLSDMADVMKDTILGTGILGFLPGGTSFETLYGYDYAGNTGAARLQASVSLGHIVGTQGSPLPNQCATVVSILGSASGRKNRGRFYFPAPAASHATTAGQADDDFVNALASALEDFGTQASGVGAGVYWLVNRHSDQGGTGLVNRCLVDTRIDTQRRRAESVVPRHTAVAQIQGS